MNKMHPDEKEMYLAEIYQDLAFSKDYLIKILDELKYANVSNYPIFVYTKDSLRLGVDLLSNTQEELKWNVNVSHLEEFVHKGIVLKDKAAQFIKVYKEHADHFCLFVTFSEEEADFVYVSKNLMI